MSQAKGISNGQLYGWLVGWVVSGWRDVAQILHAQQNRGMASWWAVSSVKGTAGRPFP